MASVEIDERLAQEEEHELSPQECVLADNAVAALPETQRPAVTQLDRVTVVRGYQTYEPRQEETNKALQSIMEWREAERYTDFLRTRLERDDEFYNLWPERIYGTDKYGHITVGIPCPQIQTDELLKFDQDHLLKLQGQKMTAITMYKARHMADASVQRYKHTLVVDLSGMGMSLLGGKTRHFLQKLFDVGGNYFPESVWKIYVVNAPFMFRVGYAVSYQCKAIWAIVKPWIHPITVTKVNIIGSPKDAIKKMAENGLDASQVPTWAGGSHEGHDVFDVLMGYIQENSGKERTPTGIDWPPLPGKPQNDDARKAAAASK